MVAFHPAAGSRKSQTSIKTSIEVEVIFTERGGNGGCDRGGVIKFVNPTEGHLPKGLGTGADQCGQTKIQPATVSVSGKVFCVTCGAEWDDTLMTAQTQV